MLLGIDIVLLGIDIAEAPTEAGESIGQLTDVVGPARDAHPLTTRLLREVGLRTGWVLATIVRFFNPQRLVLDGALSATEAFLAGVRSSVHDLCPPMTTNGLWICANRLPVSRWLRGARPR